MFSREIKQTHYQTPRTIQQAFGAYARFDVAVRHPAMREVAGYIGYAVAGLAVGGVVSGVIRGAYLLLCMVVA